jgi:hypothetical protein
MRANTIAPIAGGRLIKKIERHLIIIDEPIKLGDAHLTSRRRRPVSDLSSPRESKGPKSGQNSRGIRLCAMLSYKSRQFSAGCLWHSRYYRHA